MSSARIAGAIAALALLSAIVILAFSTFTAKDIVKPEVNVVAGTGEGPVARLNADKALTDRSRLLDDRKSAGTVDGVKVEGREETNVELSLSPRSKSSSFSLDQWGTRSPLARPSSDVRGSTSLPYVNADVYENPQSRRLASFPQ